MDGRTQPERDENETRTKRNETTPVGTILDWTTMMMMMMVSPRLFLLRTDVCRNAVSAVAVLIVSVMMIMTSSTTETTGVSYFVVQAAQPADIDSTCEDILSPASSNNNPNHERTNFTWTIVVSVSANILCASEEELEEIGQTLIQAYNDVNIFNEDLCDPNTRYVFDYEVQLPTAAAAAAAAVQSDVLPSFADDDSGDGRLRSMRRRTLTTDDDTTTKTVRKRDLQEEVPTPSPTTSFAPTSSVEFRDDDDDLGNVDLFFEITGSCSDCGDDNGLNLLSDDVERRRRRRRSLKTGSRTLQQEIPAGSNCTCSSDAEERPPTEEEWFSRFTALTEEQEVRYTFVQLTEVDESTCRSDIIDLDSTTTTTGDDDGDDGGRVFSEFDTVETITIDIGSIFGGPDDEGVVVTVSELEDAFVCTYNWLVTRYFCDPSYTSVSSATLLIDGPIVGDGVGSSSSNLTFAVNATCVNNNCTGSSIFFEELLFGLETVVVTTPGGGRFDDDDDGEVGGRWESPSGLCYCPADGPTRVPTRQEFEDAFGPCLPPLTSSSVLEECPEITTVSNTNTIPPASAPPTTIITGEPTQEPTKEPTGPPTESSTPAPTLRKPLVTESPTYGNLVIEYP